MFNSGSVVATTDFEKMYVYCETIAERDLVALIPGAKWRNDQGRWELNLTWASAKQLRSTFGEDLFLDDTIIEWGHDEWNNRIQPCLALRDLLNPTDDLGINTSSLDPRLYGYQAVGAQFLASANHGILSDPPGAGKTATAISAARILDALPALVVAPKSTLVSWGREVEQWWPGTPVYVVNGNLKERQLQFSQIRDIIGMCPNHGDGEKELWEKFLSVKNKTEYQNVILTANIMPKDSVEIVTKKILERLIHLSKSDNMQTTGIGEHTPSGECLEKNTLRGSNEPTGNVNYAEPKLLDLIIAMTPDELEEFSAFFATMLSTGQSETLLGWTELRCTCPFVIINWESSWRHSRLASYGSMALEHCRNCDRGSTRRPETCHRCEKELNQIPFRLVIADEAHRMQKPQSIQTRAVWFVGDSPSVDYRWALTGTPLTNQIDSLWSILRFINHEEHPSKVAFIDRYALTRVVPWGSGSEVIGLNPYNEEEFQEIFQPRFRRMPKEVILPQLPPIQRTRRYIEMTGPQRRAYEQMAEDMLAVTESGELLIAANPAVKMLRMVQFSSATVDLINMAEENEDPDILARLVDPSNKLDALMDDLPDLLEAGEQVVVFAVSRQLIEMAEKRLKDKKIPFSVIKGNQTQTFRQQQIDDFQNGKVPVILVVIAAGGVGVTLTAARIGIFLQRSWSFIDNHQAEGRLHRIGSEIHNSIEYIDYISEDTVDEVVVEVAEGKELRLEEIVRDAEAIRRLLAGDAE